MCADEAVDERVLVVVAGADGLDELPGPCEVALADVEQDEHRLLGQEPEAADRLLLVVVELDVADRPAGLEGFLEPREDDLLALVRLALGGRAVAAARLEPLEPPIDQRQVGEHELEVELLEVAPGVDRSLRVRQRVVLERANDVEQRVGVAQAGEMLGGQLLGPDATLRRGRRRGQVDVRDVGVDDLLRLEDLGQAVQPLVGHLDDADVEGHPAEAAGLGVAAGQRVEDGGLARSGKPDDRDLHGRSLAAGAGRRALSSPASGRPRSAAARRAANRRRLSQNSSMLRSRTRPLDHEVCGVTMTFGRS